MKRVFILCLGLIFFVILLVFYFSQRSFVQTKLQNLLHSYVQDNYHLNIHFDSLKFHMMGPSISVNQVRLNGSDIYFTAETLKARLNLGALLMAELSIQDLRMTQGIVHVQNLHIPYEELKVKGRFDKETYKLSLDDFRLKRGQERLFLSGFLDFSRIKKISMRVSGNLQAQTYQHIVPPISFIQGDVQFKSEITGTLFDPMIRSELLFNSLTLDKQDFGKTSALLFFDNKQISVRKFKSESFNGGDVLARFDIFLTDHKPILRGFAQLDAFPLEEVFVFKKSRLTGFGKGDINFTYNHNNDETIVLNGKVSFSQFQSPFKKIFTSPDFILESKVFISPQKTVFQKTSLEQLNKKFEINTLSIITKNNGVRLEARSPLFDQLHVELIFNETVSNENASFSLDGSITNIDLFQQKFKNVFFKGGMTEEVFSLKEVKFFHDICEFSLKNLVLKGDTVDIDEIFVESPEVKTKGKAHLKWVSNPSTLSGDVSLERVIYQKYLDWRTLVLKLKPKELLGLKSQKEQSDALRLDINITTARKFIFENNLLEFYGQAGMHIGGTMQYPLWSGSIDVSGGRVFFKDHQFAIQAAQVVFRDEQPNNPNYNFSLNGIVHEYRITILGSGFLNKPHISFASDPPLSNTDIASLLALGIPTSELKGGEAWQTSSVEAASYFFSSFQERFAGKARKNLGVNFRIASSFSDTKNAIRPRIFLSKNVTDNVEVHFSTTLDKETILEDKSLNLEWKLNNNLSFLGMWEDESQEKLGDHSGFGLDMKYRYEFE